MYLQDREAKPWCGYGDPEWQPEFEGDESCSVPCYPSVEVEHFQEGGTQVLGGSTEASLNITYNYGVRFHEAWEGIGLEEALNGKQASETIAALEHAVAYLGTKTTNDYWEAAPGNAGAALALLLAWARQHPEAHFKVS